MMTKKRGGRMIFSKSVKQKFSKSRKAALNLSVEAIIIFVLAFAMLGVGIFVTDQLREIGTAGIAKSQDILESIGETPTADKPIVGISKAGLDLPYKKQTQLEIGFYNGGTSTAESAILLIDECISSSTETTSSYANDDGEYPVKVVGAPVDVEASSAEGLIATMKNTNLISGETYICKLKIVSKIDQTEYEAVTFFLNVVS